MTSRATTQLLGLIAAVGMVDNASHEQRILPKHNSVRFPKDTSDKQRARAAFDDTPELKAKLVEKRRLRNLKRAHKHGTAES